MDTNADLLESGKVAGMGVRAGAETVMVAVPRVITLEFTARKWEKKGDERELVWEETLAKHHFQPDTLPQASVAFALEYGLRQLLADSYARATTGAQARKLFQERLARLLDGTLATRANADPKKKVEAKVEAQPWLAVLAELRQKEIQAKALKAVDRKAPPAKAEKTAYKAYLSAVADATLAAAGRADWAEAAKAEYALRQARISEMESAVADLDLDF